MTTPDLPAERPRSASRTWLFRALAILLGLSPFVAMEGLLRAINVGRAGGGDDPFVGFSEVWPLFVLDSSGTKYGVSPAHYKFFRPASFPAIKPRGEFRVFCLGGSTVQGSPFATETAFPNWLEISLKSHAPSRSWRVVNCGGISYASYRLSSVLKELLKYQPDLFIICEGHNEFLEDRSYGTIKQLPQVVKVPLEVASRLRTFQVLQSCAFGILGEGRNPGSRRAILGPEVQALLDYRGGLDAYHRDSAWREAVIRHFGFNLRRMVGLAQDAGVPVILVNPVANLDTPPFKSQHRDGLSAEERRRWQTLCDEARTHYADDLSEAIASLKQALAIDGQHAGTHYDLAKCYQRLGRYDGARREFIRAKDEDVCPLRILEPMRRVLQDVAQEFEVPLLDADALFAAQSQGGINGADWLVDHVHPSIVGHQLLANALTDLLAEEGYLKLNPTSLAERDRRYREHMASLDDAYFLLGQKRLGNQRLWAEGRGNRVWSTPHEGTEGPMRTGHAQTAGHASNASEDSSM